MLYYVLKGFQVNPVASYYTEIETDLWTLRTGFNLERLGDYILWIIFMDSISPLKEKQNTVCSNPWVFFCG